ncbi:MAG: ISAzo13 family transposase [Actinomycetota bacterium]|nr:ISAzo13 family transposase [Actinomycetota bacterium]
MRNLAGELRAQGHEISARSVAPLLRQLGYSLQANAKTREGASHPDRDAQFRHINATVKAALDAGEPTISVDTRKKELGGDFKNGGRELRPKGQPERCAPTTSATLSWARSPPTASTTSATMSAGSTSGSTTTLPSSPVKSIRGWWQQLGRARYPHASSLTITADCGGSNGNRTRLWKTELQQLADETGLAIRVCHFPAGTSKWNKIEHRLFSFISVNWRGKPLLSRQTIVSLIAATTTRPGLTVHARLDPRSYPKGIKITDDQLAAVNLTGNPFHPDWNYTINPRGK